MHLKFSKQMTLHMVFSLAFCSVPYSGSWKDASAPDPEAGRNLCWAADYAPERGKIKRVLGMEHPVNRG